MIEQRYLYNFYFKIPYTDITYNIDVNSNIKVREFIHLFNGYYMKKCFNIHKFYYVEIVESGNNINGDGELAPALEVSEKTLKDLYCNNYNNVSFYVRPTVCGKFIKSNDYSVYSYEQQTSNILTEISQ